MAGGAKTWVEKGKGSDKASDLNVYVSGLKTKLDAPVPAKHAANPGPYREFLRNEINFHFRKAEALKLAAETKSR